MTTTRGLLVVLLACALGACGDEPYEPGTLPRSLKFERTIKNGRVHETSRFHVGAPAPDYRDDEIAIWRPHTLFGKQVRHPGASMGIARGNTRTWIHDPWRVVAGQEYCLVVRKNGAVDVGWMRVGPPAPDEGGTRGPRPGPATVFLKLDDGPEAAHNVLGIVRIDVTRDETTRTLTEDDFLQGRWKLDGAESRAWSLRKLADDLVFDLRTVHARDGTAVTIVVDPSVSRTPVLRLASPGRLRLEWLDEKQVPVEGTSVEDVVRLEGTAARR